MRITKSSDISRYKGVPRSITLRPSSETGQFDQSMDERDSLFTTPPVINRVRKQIYDAIDQLFYSSEGDKMSLFEKLNPAEQRIFFEIIDRLEKEHYLIPHDRLLDEHRNEKRFRLSWQYDEQGVGFTPA